MASIRLATERDQALLALAISEGSKAVSEHGQYLGRTAVQKIMYFLKAAGVPMDYEFDVHYYGPFCADILSDTEYLLADGVIRDSSRRKDKYSNYEPTSKTEPFLNEHRDELDQYEDSVSQIARFFAPLEPKKLEFISTLDYVYHWVRATSAQSPLKHKVVARFLEVKPDVFPEEAIAEAYEEMVEIGAFKP